MRSVVVASGTSDVAAVTGEVTLRGFSVRESAGTAAVATVVLRDGDGTSDPARVFIELAANTSQTVTLPAVVFEDGIYVDRVAGETEIVLYLS